MESHVFRSTRDSSKQKEVIQALAEAHTSRGSDHTFDDFVVGKERGLIVLLQYGLQSFFFHYANVRASGLTGVGKTLTAEGISEHLQRPLYVVCFAFHSVSVSLAPMPTSPLLTLLIDCSATLMWQLSPNRSTSVKLFV